MNRLFPDFKVNRLALSVSVLSISCLSSGITQAKLFEWFDGEVTGSINTTVSAGVSISTANADSHLYSYNAGSDPQGKAGSGAGPNADNGRLNFKKGDVISNPYKGLTELSLEYQNVGFKGSVKYWYDHILETKNGRYTNFDDDGFHDLAKFKGIELLEAYGWAELDVAEKPLDVRVGKQVLNWGESTFMQNGINAINPLDAAAFNRPGVELKEGLLPVELVYGSLGVSNNLTLEAFYQFKWRPTVMDGCGTFFATTDAIQPGCSPIYTSPVLPENNQLHGGGVIPAGSHTTIQRAADQVPGDSGQWGVSLKYFAENLNSTEFGFYFMNYHSRLPYLNAIAANPANRAFGSPTDSADFFTGQVHPTFGSVFIEGAQYSAVYPEDIRLYGISFNTSFDSGWSMSGEISHRPNLPIQINVNDILTTSLGQGTSPYEQSVLNGLGPEDYGKELQGYVRKPVTQAQLTLTNSFPQVLGASELMVVGEAAWVHVADLESKDDIRYGRIAALGPGTPVSGGECSALPQVTEKFCTNEGFTTRNSWGYRLAAALSYSNIFPVVTLHPGLSFRHDVSGYGPQPVTSLSEGQMSVSASLKARYLDKFEATVAYTNNFGDDKYSIINDRDFLSLSISSSF
ncbi:DUF1302 domain-containing protein [Endozoicomonas numazuensis]|uniref:DUF1302 domain-containing protein n=1 Tax=Endozoicomonas numazuensis TaxID=1137799 RepID=A0A081NLZ3_9GAMM|nr:DUF1302 domain-containing protein [Endozoicomonas numazuensis]KEQ19466.1 hypothetical protein GZ78_05890 [Endozoicomonas numazuensis]